MNPIYTPGNVPQGKAPVINTFTANPSSISPGQIATLNWSSTAASYFVLSLQVGAIRGTTVTVTPTQTTSYILYATNAYGRSRATVTVTVH